VRCPIPRALLHSSFNIPGIQAPFQFPQQGPYRERGLFPGPSCTHPPESPVKEPPLQVPHYRVPSERERRFTSRVPFSHLSISLVNEPLSGSPMEPLRKEMPVFRAFSTYLPGSQ